MKRTRGTQINTRHTQKKVWFPREREESKTLEGLQGAPGRSSNCLSFGYVYLAGGKRDSLFVSWSILHCGYALGVFKLRFIKSLDLLVCVYFVLDFIIISMTKTQESLSGSWPLFFPSLSLSPLPTWSVFTDSLKDISIWGSSLSVSFLWLPFQGHLFS